MKCHLGDVIRVALKRGGYCRNMRCGNTFAVISCLFERKIKHEKRQKICDPSLGSF